MLKLKVLQILNLILRQILKLKMLQILKLKMLQLKMLLGTKTWRGGHAPPAIGGPDRARHLKSCGPQGQPRREGNPNKTRQPAARPQHRSTHPQRTLFFLFIRTA